jgi:hypothetical protein
MSTNRSPGQQPAPYPELAPLRAMIDLLSPQAREELGLVLHARLHRPKTAATRRVEELGLLARLLDEYPQPPGHLPYVERKLYDERRLRERPGAPTSARLQRKFRTWRRACDAAWGLREDGRSRGSGMAWTRLRRHPQNYRVEEAIASVRASAEVFGRIPSSWEYHQWIINRRRRARDSGQTTHPFVPYKRVLGLVASDRSGRDGWQLEA